MRLTKRRAGYWTRDRVLGGLRRAAADLYGDDPARLPRDQSTYRADISPLDANNVGPRRRYTPAHQIARHFPSLSHAWHELGLIAEGQCYQRGGGYWTRARMIEAGAAFFREHGVAPTNHNWWHEATKELRNEDLPGRVNIYPSYPTLIDVGGWRGMRDFWVDVRHAHPGLKIETDMTDMPWRAVEDWFVVESVGILPRAEVARLMRESGFGRTEPAIKRRLYDLGVNSYDRWGWTIQHAERVLAVSGATIRKYMAHGLLPYYRSHKCIYIDPADLFVIAEYNWKKKRHPRELDEAVRKSLALRVCYTLLGYDWRRYAYHRARPEHEFFAGRAESETRRHPAAPPPPRPKHIRAGQWAVITGEWLFKTPGARERKGEVKSVYWSSRPAHATQKSPQRPPCWMARVELPKLKAHGRPQYQRVIYHVPLDNLTRVRKPRAARPTAEVASAARKKAAKKAPRSGGKFAAPARTRAATPKELPLEYGCNLCGLIKPLDEMVVVHVRREKVYRLRPRCKSCHNERERGHRREYKREYLRRWRNRNSELTESYWKDKPDYRERSRESASRYVGRHRDALAIRRRLKSRGIEVSVGEAEGLLKQFGPCYPSRFGLTPEGLKECERIRRGQRRLPAGRRQLPVEIRIGVYAAGLFVPPDSQQRPYQKRGEHLRRPGRGGLAKAA